ncbi:putative ABC transport system permease protein [Balneicella halophila]|uniref:Putative ABC transport system permease protein n=1 Tax=Balneicella halophila TaxID=1537566 RepID=A0A7L4UQ34_BALHA|nr:ABC transporter permease [Balneicella halophila]PVX51853.1 putative ABC transport system permease protein [Balneicella halophila]
MFNRDNWIEIWSTIKSNKLRSVLTAFGVFWGIFILIIMLGASKGFEDGLNENFEGIATNSAFMWSQSSSIPYKGYNAGRRWTINNYDIKSIKTLVPDLDLIAPRLQGSFNDSGENVVYGEMKGSYSVFGDYPEYFQIIPIDITSGRSLNQRDIDEERKVCVIGEDIVEEIFRGTDPIDEYIEVDNVYFKIVGVAHPKTQMNIGSNPKSTVYIPFTTLQKTYGYGNEVHFFCFTAKKDVMVEEVEEDIKAFLLKQHDLSPEDTKAIGGFNMQKEFIKLNGVYKGVSFLSWIVGLGTLLAGIIGVGNIMLIVIKERTKEIGIKRALGAQSKMIRNQILFESAILTVFAGFFGLFFSVAFLELVSMISDEATKDAFIHFVPEANLRMGLAALVILILGGIFAGLFPASRATSIKPIDALRDE